MVTITAGPKRPGRYRRWIKGVALLLDAEDQPFGATIAVSLLKSRTISLPLKAYTPRRPRDK